MSKKYILLMATTLVSTTLHSQTFLHNPAPLKDYVATSTVDSEQRLRIVLAPESGPSNVKLTVGGVVVCSDTACYRGNLKSTSVGDNGTTIISDSTVPELLIKSVHIESVIGGNVATGALKLARPLNIARGTYGGEIFVTLKPLSDGKGKAFVPSYATASWTNETTASMYYRPAFSSHISLKHGVSVSIPSGALAHPEIFSIAVHDTGERYPMVDIYPTVALKVAGRVQASAISRPPQTQDNRLKPLVVGPPVGMNARNVNDVGNVKERSIKSTGISRNNDFANDGIAEFVKTSFARSAIPRYYSTPCAELLSNPLNMAAIAELLNAPGSPGVVYVNWCKDIAPYIHIIYYGGSQIHKIGMPNTRVRKPGTVGDQQLLKRLNEHAPNPVAAINGGMWEGDLGWTGNQFGLVKGYVRANGVILGDNQEGGGDSGGTGLSDGNKFMIGTDVHGGQWSTRETAVVGNILSNYNVMSSSTSIYKNGECSTDTSVTGPSTAIGHGGNNSNYVPYPNTTQTVMVSSATGTSTNASELCDVFRSFGIGAALMLDGGSSTSMLIGSGTKNAPTLLNPLPLISQQFFGGTMRRIAWAFSIQPK